MKIFKNRYVKTIKKVMKKVYGFSPLIISLIIIYLGIMNLPDHKSAAAPKAAKHNHSGGAKKSKNSHDHKQTKTHDHSKASINSINTSDNMENPQSELWTCSMHPQIKRSGPGKCPICGMDLIKVQNTSQGGSGWNYTMTKNAQKLAAVETTKVRKIKGFDNIFLKGTIGYNEKRITDVTSWVAGRIERLYVNFRGKKIKKYSPLLSVYSPELYAAQLEYLNIYNQIKSDSSSLLSKYRDSTLSAVQTKLRLAGFNSYQIKMLKKRNKPMEYVTIYSPVSGVVIKKNVQKGTYVNPGTVLFQVVDKSKLWVFFDVYEKDVRLIKIGSEVEYETTSNPGLKFTGKIEYIDPDMNVKNGTLKVRASVNDEKGLLREGMLVKGITSSADDHKETLVVPASAVLYTGHKSVVYVQTDKGPGNYEGRIVELGVENGGNYIVKSGLHEGELVVNHGAFLIDSDLQIIGKPSMMAPKLTKPLEIKDSTKKIMYRGNKIVVSAKFKEKIVKLIDIFFTLHQGFKSDNLVLAQKGAKKFIKELTKIEKNGFRWKSYKNKMLSAGKNIITDKNIKEARVDLYDLSMNLIRVIQTYNVQAKNPVYVQYCPMARHNKGGFWLQKTKKIENPYFGKAMFGCGETAITIEGKK